MSSPCKDLPDEIWEEILDYLVAGDIIPLLAVSRTFFKIIRANRFWKSKCLAKDTSQAPVAVPHLPAIKQSDHHHDKRTEPVYKNDHTSPLEDIDWYSDYTARHAPLEVDWLDSGADGGSEIRGFAVLDDSRKALACRADGSISVLDFGEPSIERRRFNEIERTQPGILFQDRNLSSSSSRQDSSLTFAGVTECLNIDPIRGKAYVAIRDLLNEVDLDTMAVILQTKYAWRITALSQDKQDGIPVSVGTSWSLHLHDPRQPIQNGHNSFEHRCDASRSQPEDFIAFFQNPMKSCQESRALLRPVPFYRTPEPRTTTTELLYRRNHEAVDLAAGFAPVEPGPLSILHEGDNNIFIAGRFPSIMSYDRRFFPRLQYVIHSGARLSCLTSLPYPPKPDWSRSRSCSTLIACGEYNGRGSLELYSLPFCRGPVRTSAQDSMHSFTELDFPEMSDPDEQDPFSYRNRQDAASSKLLSVAVQGSRIVFSDSDGGLKWVERDGRGLVRRWNINPWQYDERGGSVVGEQVVRKMAPLAAQASEYGMRGDNDLLVWTGERLGIVTTKPKRTSHAELVRSFQDGKEVDDQDEMHLREVEYSRTMRQALERQADERRWMGRFQFKHRFG